MNVYKIRNEILNGKNISNISLKVVFYARVSTDYDTQISSLENQVEFFEEYIKRNKNWIYSGSYIDEGISGTSTLKRGNFLKMINDAKLGKFDLIITKNVPRFARNTLDSITYTQQLLANGVGVLFLNDNINTLLPDSDLRLAIMSSIAQDEVRKLSENVKFGLKKSLDRGVILGGNNLYGYNKQKGILIKNEDEAKKIKRIYEIYSTGKYNYSTLSKKLKQENILDRNNKQFYQSTLKRILTNPKYKGFYCGNKTKKIDYKLKNRININKNEWKIYKTSKIDNIITEELWNKVNNIIERKEKNKSIFKNKIKCNKHKTYFTRSANKYLTCNLYKKGKKYCNTPIIKEEELIRLITKILKVKQEKLTKILDYIEVIVEKNNKVLNIRLNKN